MPTQQVITTYKFDELSSTAQKKAIEWMRKCRMEDIEDNNEIKNFFKEMLAEAGLSGLKIYFSLNYCQGDGVAFDGTINIANLVEQQAKLHKTVKKLDKEDNAATQKYHQFLKEMCIDQKVLKLMWKLYAKDILTCVYVKHFGHYYHYNSMNIEIEEREDNNNTKTLQNYWETYIKNLSKLFEKKGYEIIDANDTDEYLSQLIRINDFSFTEKGSRSVTL